jgi:uncharacterized protein YjiS (DUF1127 family)
VNALRRLTVSDELDWWMHYLVRGLYFEGEPDEGPIRFASLTDALDAWVLHDRGIRQRPAPKPAMKLHAATREFLDLICSERPDGWISGASILLDANGESQKQLWKGMRKLRGRARQRQRLQRMTLGFSEGPDPMLICAIVTPDGDGPRLPEALDDLVSERLNEFGDQRVLAIGRTLSSRRPYDALVVVDRAWWELPTGSPSAGAAVDGADGAGTAVADGE